MSQIQLMEGTLNMEKEGPQTILPLLDLMNVIKLNNRWFISIYSLVITVCFKNKLLSISYHVAVIQSKKITATNPHLLIMAFTYIRNLKIWN